MSNPQKIICSGNIEELKKIQDYINSLPKERNIKVELENQEVKTDKLISPEIIEDFQKKLDNNNFYIREEAALDLGITRDPQGIDLLLPKIEDENLEVRQAVCHALGEIGVNEKKVVDALINRLKNDTDLEVKQIVALALGKIGSQDVIPSLLECLNKTTKEAWFVKEAIAQALGMINLEGYQDKNKVIESLKELAKEKDVFIQKSALFALEKINSQQPATVTQESTAELNNETEVKQESELPSESPPIKLLNWLEEKGSQLGDLVTETFKPLIEPNQYAYGWRNLNDEEQERNYTTEKIKDLGIRLNGHFIALVVSLKQENPEKIKIRLRLIPQAEQQYLPQGLTLAILDENNNSVLDKSGAPLQTYARERDKWIQLELSGRPDEAFQVQIAKDETNWKEKFTI